MLPIDERTVRLFLHVLGATVWVGGQVALAFLVPVLRRAAGPDVVRATARRFQLVAWPAFGVLLVTGIWNLVAVDFLDADSEYLTTLAVKLACVVLSGLFAAGHAMLTGPAVTRARDEVEARRRRALSGATAGLALLFALAATFFGVVLHG